MAEDQERASWRGSPATEPGYRKGEEPANKGKLIPPTFIEGADVVALMNALTRGSGAVRDRALIAMLYRTGMGIVEALTLTIDDLDPERGSIRIERSNEHRRRTVAMDAGGWVELEKWLSERARLGIPGRMLFTVISRVAGEHTGNPISSPQFRVSLKRAAARANVGRVHPAGFRYTLAAELILEGWPLPHIQTQLGVTTLTGVQELLNNLGIGRPDDDEVAAIIRTRVWEPELTAIDPPKVRPTSARAQEF